MGIITVNVLVFLYEVSLDPFSATGADSGITRMARAIILPQRPFQVLAELDPPGFREVRKFVVSPGGRVLSYR